MWGRGLTTEGDHISERKAKNSKDMEGNKGGGRRDTKGQKKHPGKALHISD